MATVCIHEQGKVGKVPKVIIMTVVCVVYSQIKVCQVTEDNGAYIDELGW